MSHWFANRSALIVSLHKKETVIAPVILSALGVTCTVSTQVNTDTLGTFSGEINRKSSPYETALEKCRLGNELEGADIVIASEGSFGPHPFIPFIPSNEEWLVWKDFKLGYTVSTSILSTDTNFASLQLDASTDINPFLQQVHFPSHGLICSSMNKQWIIKGIDDKIKLEKCIAEGLALHDTIELTTDMRAHFNPTRMKVIEAAAEALVKKLVSYCPSCHTPGFDVVQVERGLVCEQCLRPTQSIRSVIKKCLHCGAEETFFYPNNKTREDPMYCDFCNP
ncbi:MAG: hypothetical protein MUE33_11280 [Cytophagaceae bacterium]|jgi:hypothetical protein|nr:hypothetical protein [Cytophagaceae bacterium]